MKTFDRITITERRMEVLGYVFDRLTYQDYQKIGIETGIKTADAIKIIEQGWTQIKKAWRHNARLIPVRTNRRLI